jgi:hypothetical protein
MDDLNAVDAVKPEDKYFDFRFLSAPEPVVVHQYAIDRSTPATQSPY